MKSLNGAAVVAAWSAMAVGGVAVAQDAMQWRVEDGGNGHWYQFRPIGFAPSWSAASDIAEQSGGHLATVTSPPEMDFVMGLGPCTSCPCCGGQWWLGGYQAADASEPAGDWQWVTGESWEFSPWASSEPNNQNGVEDYLYLICAEALFNDGRDLGNGCTGGVIEWSADCNGDGIVDYGQILDGTFEDANANGVPDCCEEGVSCDPCPGDVNFDGIVNGADISVTLGFWGLSGKPNNADINNDGIVNGADLAFVLGNWGECP